MKHKDLQQSGQAEMAQELQGPADVPDTTETAPKKKRRWNRAGKLTKAEVQLVNKIVMDQPGDMRPGQVQALAKVMNRSIPLIKRAVENAKLDFAENAKNYVDLHMKSAQGAFDRFDFETAGKLSQWALEKIGLQGSRVVEQATERPVLPSVVIGVNLGGIGTVGEKPTIEVLPAPPDDPLDN